MQTSRLHSHWEFLTLRSHKALNHANCILTLYINFTKGYMSLNHKTFDFLCRFMSHAAVTGILYDYRCAMSLLHSRINRVHYDTPTNSGALGTLYRLHCNPKLNHNFTVTRTIKPAGDGVS